MVGIGLAVLLLLPGGFAFATPVLAQEESVPAREVGLLLGPPHGAALPAVLVGHADPDVCLRSCSPSAVTAFDSSALGERLVASIATMKKASSKRRPRVGPDDILPEYDFSKGRRNPYAARMAAGSHIIVLEPDVAAVFPDAAAVNGALRALAGIIRERRPRSGAPRRKSRRGSA
jgi:hypothetical protein